MQKIQPQLQVQAHQQKWQAYQSQSNNQSIFKSFHQQIKNILLLLLLSSIFYLIITLLSPLTIFAISILIAASVKLVKVKVAQVKKQGFANKLSPKLREILLEKSIFDIYSDLLYFPLVTKIIGAFFKPILSKPHPEELPQSFQQLPQNIQAAITRKGLLSLTPYRVQELVVSKDGKEKIPKVFGNSSWEWYNLEKYQNHHQKIHEQTIGKKLIQKIDNKISWPGFTLIASIVSFGVYKMKPNKVKKMLIQNGSFMGILLVTLIALIKIKQIKNKIKKQKQDKQQIQEIQNNLLDKDN